MKRVIFINIDPEQIKSLLERIGKVRFEKALENRNFTKPNKLDKFKLVWEGKNASLNYKFSIDYIEILIVKDYELPAKGWEIEVEKY